MTFRVVYSAPKDRGRIIPDLSGVTPNGRGEDGMVEKIRA